MSVNLTKKISLIFILTIAIILVIDSTIVKYFTYSNSRISSLGNIGIFVIFCVIFGVSGLFIINSVRRLTISQVYKLQMSLKYFHHGILTIQVLEIAILFIIVLQMLALQTYSIIWIHVMTFLAHLSAVTFMVVLASIFLGWYYSRKNYLTLLYTIGFLLLSANIIVSLIYLESNPNPRSYMSTVRSYPMHFYITTAVTTQWTEALAALYDVLSITSFIIVWAATLSLLYQYRLRLGRAKFFALTGVPLVYYLFPFEVYFGNIFSPLLLDSPITFSIIYLLVFSATKQVGALLFSLAFLSASSLITKDKVRKSLLISAIGISIVFGINEVATLQYRMLPPYGLISAAFMPLGSYLLLIGLFTSASNVAQDTELRKEFYKTAKSQLALLKTIGVTQMEKELESKFKIVEKRVRMSGTTEAPVEDDVKKLLHDVLSELYSKEKSKNLDK